MFKREAFETMILKGKALPANYIQLVGGSDNAAGAYFDEKSPLFKEAGYVTKFFSRTSNLDENRVVDKKTLILTTKPLSVFHLDVDMTGYENKINDFIKYVELTGLNKAYIDNMGAAQVLEEKLTDNYNETLARCLEEYYNNGGDGVNVNKYLLSWMLEDKTDDEVFEAADTLADELVSENTDETSDEESESWFESNGIEFKSEDEFEPLASEEEAPAQEILGEETAVEVPVSKEKADTVATVTPAPAKEAETNITAPAPERENKEDAEEKPVRELTEEEMAENKVLRDNMRKIYEDCLNAIAASCNTLFVPIKARVKEAIEKDEYEPQLCFMYLDVCDDLTSDVYKELYEADLAAEEFNKKVHRQYVHMGCPGCNHSWDEDVTFLEKGIHEIHCPKCNMSRRIER